MNYGDASEQILNNSEIIGTENTSEVIRTSGNTYKGIVKITGDYYNKMRDDGTQPDEYYDYSIQHGRLKTLATGVSLMFVKGARKANTLQLSNGYKTGTNGFYQTRYLAEFVSSSPFRYYNKSVQDITVTGSIDAWTDLSKQIRDRIEKNYGKIQRYYPQYGTLSDVLVSNNTKALKAIEQTIGQNLRNGKTHRELAKDLKKILDTTTSNAVKIARTETTRNSNSAAQGASEVLKSQGIDARRQWLATLDGRTRPTHAAADGQKEDAAGLFHVGGSQGASPGNMDQAGESVNCRCTSMTLIDDVQPETRTGRDPVTGEVTTFNFKNFPEWADKNNLKWTKAKGWEPK